MHIIINAERFLGGAAGHGVVTLSKLPLTPEFLSAAQARAHNKATVTSGNGTVDPLKMLLPPGIRNDGNACSSSATLHLLLTKKCSRYYFVK